MGISAHLICVKNRVVKSESRKTHELMKLSARDTANTSSPRLLPAERPIGRVGFAPTGDRRLSGQTGYLRYPRKRLLAPQVSANTLHDLFPCAWQSTAGMSLKEIAEICKDLVELQ